MSIPGHADKRIIKTAPQAGELTVAEAAAEVSLILEGAMDEVLSALDEHDWHVSRDAVDQLRWRWQIENRLADLFDTVRDCVDELMAEVAKVRQPRAP